MTYFEKFLKEHNDVEVAYIAGMSNVTAVQKWRKKTTPRLATLEKIARHLGIPRTLILSPIPKNGKN